jgi:hypothetical protein
MANLLTTNAFSRDSAIPELTSTTTQPSISVLPVEVPKIAVLQALSQMLEDKVPSALLLKKMIQETPTERSTALR